jgi:hypothetical protein
MRSKELRSMIKVKENDRRPTTFFHALMYKLFKEVISSPEAKNIIKQITKQPVRLYCTFDLTPAVKVGEELDEIMENSNKDQYRPEMAIEDVGQDQSGGQDDADEDEDQKIHEMSGNINEIDISNQGKTGTDLIVVGKDKNLRTKTQNSLKGNDAEKSFSQNKQDESFNIKNTNIDRVIFPPL